MACKRISLFCFALIMKLFCLSLLIAAVLGRDCDRAKCKGPIKFYEDLNCKPIYKDPSDCCAFEYDCSHLRNRSADKCYANGHEYEIGQKIREQDCFNPCDKQCICFKGDDQVAKFSCPLYNCYPKEAETGCYFRRRLDSCCGSEQICPEDPKSRFKCEFNEKTYLDGERFYPEANLLCQCGEGYEGKNVAPFCRRTSCGVEYKYPREIRENCAPIIYEPNSFVNPCIFSFRCQTSNDSVNIAAVDNIFNDNNPEKFCKFGNLKLNIGQTVTRSEDQRFSCVECTCEVPPILTCIELSDNDCNGF